MTTLSLFSIQRTLNQFRINARKPCCYGNPMFIGLTGVCAGRLNVVAMQWRIQGVGGHAPPRWRPEKFFSPVY